MKLFLAVIFLLVTAFPASAQTAKVFIKGDSEQCWQALREVVYFHARLVTENDELKTLRAGNFSTMAGDTFLTIQALPEKNKKGEAGCGIYVDVEGGGYFGAPINVVNDLSVNTQIANRIAAETASMMKARVNSGKNT
jgi:hypothetical protein